MTPEQVLSYPARVLSQKQREFYFDNGYVSVDSLIDGEWLDRLHAVTDKFLEKRNHLKKRLLLKRKKWIDLLLNLNHKKKRKNQKN